MLACTKTTTLPARREASGVKVPFDAAMTSGSARPSPLRPKSVRRTCDEAAAASLRQ
jgi:hypothetical protein